MGDFLKITEFRGELEKVQIIEPLSHNWGKQEPNNAIFTNGCQVVDGFASNWTIATRESQANDRL